MYECHITCRRSDLGAANIVAVEQHWKTSEIARDPVLGEDTYAYLTTYDNDFQHMLERLSVAKQQLEHLGALIIREKIELIVYDKRHVQPTGRKYDSIKSAHN